MKRSGYKTSFIGKNFKVNHPGFSDELKTDILKFGNSRTGRINYIHYSVVASKTRKLAIYSAANISGISFKKITRKEVFQGKSEKWFEDERIGNGVLNQELYDAKKDDFDRGHMTKREDTQWGRSKDDARKAAFDTFHFPNCAPQVLELNRRIWRSLEDYILKNEVLNRALEKKLRICAFTGPVLKANDPIFVKKVEGEAIQIPELFWKVIYYLDKNKVLSRVAFMMGQRDILKHKGVVKEHPLDPFEGVTVPDEFFHDYKDAETYQVNVETVERFTGLHFMHCREPYTDTRPTPLIVEDAELDVEDFFEGKKVKKSGMPLNLTL